MSTSAAQDNVSITATEGTVAGSSVAITEAEEDFSLGGGGGTSADINNEKVTITKEHSLDISIANDTSEGVNEDDDEDEEDAAPMHLHALRTPAKLKGVARSRSSSRSRPGSRRSSSSPESKAAAAIALGELVLGSTVSPSASVGSSLDGIGDHHHHNHSEVDPDILLDKLGFRDLDPNATQEELQELLRKHISSQGGLPTLNERMSEATMDDTQAFHDLSYVVGKKASANASSSIDEGDGEEGNSPEKAARTEAAVRLAQLKSSGLSNSAVLCTMTPLLNTLDEGEGEDDVDEEGDDDNTGKKSRSNSAAEEDGEDVVVEIPAGMVNLKKKNSNIRRDTFNSIATVGQISSQDEEDDDDNDNADVVVPTEVVDELNINEGRRKLLHSDTSMAVVTGKEPDYLEADEQDGLEADRASDEEEPPR